MTFRKIAPQKFFCLSFALSLFILLEKQSCGELIQLTSVQDNSIYEENETRSNALGGIFVGRTNGGGGTLSRRGLLEFDVSSIPSGATIDSVQLQLELFSTNDASTRTIDLHRLISPWGEGTSSGGGQGAPATTSDATWEHNFFSTSLWNSPGGDFQTLASDSISVGNAGTFIWSSTAMVDDVQAWVDNNAINHGWILIGEENNLGTARVFASREDENISIRPKLTVEFTAVPEPESFVLILIGFVSVVMIYGFNIKR